MRFPWSIILMKIKTSKLNAWFLGNEQQFKLLKKLPMERKKNGFYGLFLNEYRAGSWLLVFLFDFVMNLCFQWQMFLVIDKYVLLMNVTMSYCETTVWRSWACLQQVKDLMVWLFSVIICMYHFYSAPILRRK